MKKALVLVIVLTFITNLVKAQNLQMYLAFRKIIKVNENVFRSNEYHNKTVLFSLSIGVSNFGMVDTVIFSGNNKDLTRLYNLKAIVKDLKANKKDFKNYKNEFLTCLIVLIRGEKNQIKIDNGTQYLESWLGISKSSSFIERTGKRNIFLGPIVTHFGGKMGN